MKKNIRFLNLASKKQKRSSAGRWRPHWGKKTRRAGRIYFSSIYTPYTPYIELTITGAILSKESIFRNKLKIYFDNVYID